MSFWHSSSKLSILPAKPDWSVSFVPSANELQTSIPIGNHGIIAGEVWLANRTALGQQLGASSLTDLEMIAALWKQHGEQCVPMLQGMFAFVVWDPEQKAVLLVRDRVGSRTLYYSTEGATRWIAPRLRTLEQKLSTAIDPVALRDYLCCAFVPGERTMWSGIREVRPGTIVRLPGNEVRPYWQIEERLTETEHSLEWHARRLRMSLDEVIGESLPQSEAVGCYLSGGLDSSLVAALAKKLHAHSVHTYSIHFGSATPNELEFSSLVAAHCQTRHHIIEITPQQMWDLHAEAIALLDDPIGDPLTVPNLILGREAKKSVNVILNGEGGDPCFGGPKNQPMLLTNLYQSADPTTAPDLVAAYLASYQKCSTDLPRLLRSEVWNAVKTEPSVFEPELFGGGSYLNRLMFINTKFKGADHILTKVSNLTRACELEGRSPLFDQRIVELSLTIPPEYKLSGVTEKAVLKAAVQDVLPETILARPKSGMMVPVQYWFRKLWPKQARALLLHRKARVREFLNPEVIDDWLNYRGDTWSRYGVKLWLLVSLELWLQTHGE
ncbi:MAG: 7-cyano-7-deazaguanine synthase [Blastocatellia bacterium]|nr:7-cyano-7-deazaguanine synthase [Blastocatellia bacterium]